MFPAEHNTNNTTPKKPVRLSLARLPSPLLNTPHHFLLTAVHHMNPKVNVQYTMLELLMVEWYHNFHVSN